MTRTKVVNIAKAEEYDIYIGRTGHGYDGYFGNPFKVPPYTRSESIEAYNKYARERVSKDPEFRKRVKELYGKRLGCFCKPLACHGDVLVKLTHQLNMEDDVFDIHDK